MRFAFLGSGSAGNALLVEQRGTRVLVDCGFGVAETRHRLERLGIAPDTLTAIVVTHEHDDHVSGVGPCARRFGVPVYLTSGTLRAVAHLLEGVEVRPIVGHARFCVGDLEIEPYPVPHDAREPAQYVLGDGQRRLGVITDAGAPTAHIVRTLSGVDALVLECNHDIAMLAAGPYPAKLRARVGGRFGHLENSQAADLLGAIDRSRLQHLVAAHLSRKNNRPELAVAALVGVLGCSPDWIAVADQDTGLGWREVA